MISEGLWRTRFGADPSIIGEAVVVDGTPRVVIGVVPSGAAWPRPDGVPDLYFALPDAAARLGRDDHRFEVIGRLRPTTTLDAARTELATIAARQAREFPRTNRGWTLTANHLGDEVVGGVRRGLLILLGAVGFVLLIVCANVAGLLVARATTRRHEVAIRRALGASSARVVRQVAAESVLLALGGGLLGVICALWGVDLLRASASESLPRIESVRVDASVVLFTAGLAGLTALLCGILPALASVRSQLQDVLKDGARVAVPRRGTVGRGALVVTEIALAVVLLAGAGLMARSLERLNAIPLGFNPDNVIAIDIDLLQPRYRAPENREQFVKQVEARVVRCLESREWERRARSRSRAAAPTCTSRSTAVQRSRRASPARTPISPR